MSELKEKESTASKVKLGLVAGNGELPLLLAKSALEKGVDLTVCTITKDAKDNFKSFAKSYDFPLIHYTPFDVFQMLDEAKERQVNRITFIGKVPKLDFFKNLHKLDASLVKKLKELNDLRDDSIHGALVKFLSEYGLAIENQTTYVREFFPGPQIFTERKPTVEEQTEIDYGIKLAKEIAALDVGQTVVVQNKSPLALEAIEGTDECIKRGKKLANGKAITVCKVSKPDQDQRFDIPVVGLQTLKCAGKNSIIALEANETFLLDQEKVVEYANKNNICLLAV